MAPESGVKGSSSQKKRKFSKPSSSQPAKRRKNTSNGKVSGKQRRVVALNDMRWKPVAMPEMFDEADGFFGLEELEGVDVVRDGNNVQFVTDAAEDSAADSDEFHGFSDDEPGQAKTGSTSDSEQKATQAEHKPEEAVKTKAKDRKKQKKGEEKSQVEPKSKETKKTKDDKKNAADPTSSRPRESDTELSAGGFSMLADLDDSNEEESTDVSEWMALDLSPPLLSCLGRLKFSKPTAIQAAAIPEILAGHDVIGKASTGSGKTLAFGIPIVQAWLGDEDARKGGENTAKDEAPPKTPTALILSPTRELAHQITKHIKELCAALPKAPYVCSVTGGLSVLKQQRQLETADIVVGTPGRLWEVLSGNRPLLAAFRAIPFVVVDEADRLLSDGHFKEAEDILLALNQEEFDEEEQHGSGEGENDQNSQTKMRPRQTLVFSATFNKGLQQKLAGKGRYDLMDQAESMAHLLRKLNFREAAPKFIDVNPVSQMAARLREGMVECGATDKDLYLYTLLMLQPTRRTLVFANSISSVRRLAPMLQNLQLPVVALHSQMPQKARLRSIERFKANTGAGATGGGAAHQKSKRSAILLATDVAARGLDIPGIDVVIHYHVPRTADNYVHRSGRTARAAQAGLSILLCAPEEVVPTRRLVGKVHAEAARGEGKASALKMSRFISSIDVDRRLVSRLRERLVLAKKIADSVLAKEKGNKDENWMRAAAEELGVEYDGEDSDNDLATVGAWSGRGSGRRKREKEASQLSKAELAALRAQLNQLLSRRINAGVSERYLASGEVDMEELLRCPTGDFLGKVEGLEIDMA